jgi:hypothetical protein
LPKRNVYMAIGYHCQVIMMLPALDTVAVMTARDFYPFGVVTDNFAGAVKSETALTATYRRGSRPGSAPRPRPQRRSRARSTRFPATPWA